MKKILSLLSVFIILFSITNTSVIAASKYTGKESVSEISNSGISSTLLKTLITDKGLTVDGLKYVIKIKKITSNDLLLLRKGTSIAKNRLIVKLSSGGLSFTELNYLKNNSGLTTKGLTIVGSSVSNTGTNFLRKVNNNGVYQVNFKSITANNAGKTLETWTGKENFPKKILLKNGMALDLDDADLDKQFVKTNSLKSRAINLKRQNIDFGTLDLKEPEIRLLPDRLQIVQKTTIEFKTETQLKNIKEKLDIDGNMSGQGQNNMNAMFSGLDENLPTGATKTLQTLASTNSLREDPLPTDMDSKILNELKVECKIINGVGSSECSEEKIEQDFDLATKTLEGEEIISFSLIPPTAEQVKSGDLNIKKNPKDVRMSIEQIEDNFEEYGMVNQEVIENTDSESDESLYSQTNPFDNPNFCVNQHGIGTALYEECDKLMKSRNNPKEKEYNKMLLNGFTVGKADSYEWKKTLKVDLWVKTIKIFEVKFGFYYSYGFGLRIPIKAKVKVNKDVADNWNDENSNYEFEVSAETFDAAPSDYSDMGISDHQIFNGKEFVFEFKAGFTYKIRAFRSVVNINGNIGLFDILIAVLGKDEIMNSLGLSEEEYNKLVREKGIDKSLNFEPPFDGSAQVSLAKFGLPVPIIDWAYFRMLGFIGTEVLLDGGITADCKMLNSNGGCNGKSEIKRTPRVYNANAVFSDNSKKSDELGFYSNFGPSFGNFRYYPELLFRIFAKAGASVKIPIYGWKTVRSPEITIYEMTISSDNLYLGTHDGTDGKLEATNQKIYSTNPNIVLNTPNIKVNGHNNAAKFTLKNVVSPGTWYVYTLDGQLPNCLTSERYNGNATSFWRNAQLEPIPSKRFVLNVQGCSVYGDKTDILKTTVNLENQSFDMNVISDAKLGGYFKFNAPYYEGRKIAYTLDGTNASCENPSTQNYVYVKDLHLTDTLSESYTIPINALTCNSENQFIESKRFKRTYTVENHLYDPIPRLEIAGKEVSASYYPEAGYETYIKYKLSSSKITSVSGDDFISCEGDWEGGKVIYDNAEETDQQISGLTDFSNTYVQVWKTEENKRFGGTFIAHLGAKTLFAKTCIRDVSGNLVFQSGVKIANIPEIRDGSEVFDSSKIGIHDVFLDSLKNGGLDGFLDRDGMIDFLETNGGLTPGGARDMFGLMGNGQMNFLGLKSMSFALNPNNKLSQNQKTAIFKNSYSKGALSKGSVEKFGQLLKTGKVTLSGLVALNSLVENPNAFDGYNPSPMNNIPSNNPTLPQVNLYVNTPSLIRDSDASRTNLLDPTLPGTLLDGGVRQSLPLGLPPVVPRPPVLPQDNLQGVGGRLIPSVLPQNKLQRVGGGLIQPALPPVVPGKPVLSQDNLQRIGGGLIPSVLPGSNLGLGDSTKLFSNDEYVNQKLDEINDCFKSSYKSHLENIEKTIKLFENNRDKSRDKKTKQKYEKAIDKLVEIKDLFIKRYSYILEYDKGNFLKTSLEGENKKNELEVEKEKIQINGALNLHDVFRKLEAPTKKIENDINNHINNMDSSNTEDIKKLQQMMQKWTIATQLQSNTMKTISKGVKSTIQNIR